MENSQKSKSHIKEHYEFKEKEAEAKQISEAVDKIKYKYFSHAMKR